MTSPLERKIKVTGPTVATANRVADGAVVYRDADGGWTTDLDEAAIATNAAVARDLIDGASADNLRAVDPYLAPVKLTNDGKVRPGNLRELIRRDGPTIELPMTFAISSMQKAGLQKIGLQKAGPKKVSPQKVSSEKVIAHVPL